MTVQWPAIMMVTHRLMSCAVEWLGAIMMVTHSASELCCGWLILSSGLQS